MNSFSEIIDFQTSDYEDSFNSLNVMHDINMYDNDGEEILNFCNLHSKFNKLNFGHGLGIIKNPPEPGTVYCAPNTPKFGSAENSINQNLNLTEELIEIKNLSTNNSFQNLEKIYNNSFSYLVNNNKDTSFISNSPNTTFSCKNDCKEESLNSQLYFHCNFPNCKKLYKTKENLQLHHKNIHLNQKPYNCVYCDKKFSHRTGRAYHERKFHTKIFPYKCAFEGKIIKKINIFKFIFNLIIIF